MATMTIKECMDAALQLVNQYTIDGALVPLSYNAQADDVLRMVNLINDAQMQIATAVKPIAESVSFEVGAEDIRSGVPEITYKLTDYCMEVTGVSFSPIRDRSRSHSVGSYHLSNDGTITLPVIEEGVYRVEYNRYPVRYSQDVNPFTQLDNTPDTHPLIPYYVAAMLSIEENPKLYYALYNVWETRLSRLSYKTPHAENGLVEDVYGFSNFRGVW